MSYDSVRMNEQMRILDHSIDHFIDRYNFLTILLALAGANPVRQTLFLFPGGIASKLKRATRAWQATGPASQVFNYTRVWGTENELLGGMARNLKMRRTATGRYRDKGNRIIIADGVINLFGFSPYLFFTAWCAFKQLDCFIFPWDWRRSVDDVGTFFVERFLPHFQARVQDECNNADPLADYSLIGHSAGGLVVNWILRNVAPPGTLRKAITVAAPFYGYGGQLHRWFEGEPAVNEDGLYTQEIIKTLSSFPGCYLWHFLPEPFYTANQAAFQSDPGFPLASYPSVDLATNSTVDPYNPQPPGQRYLPPALSGFDFDELENAEELFGALTSPLTAAQAAKLVNIRGDNTGNTRSATSWRLLPPFTPSPITDTFSAPGDGTQPGWTTRDIGLAQQVPGNVITVIGVDADHVFIMDSPQTHARLAAVLGVP